MQPTSSRRRLLWLLAAALPLLAAGIFFALRIRAQRPENQAPGKFPEQLVYVHTSDDFVQAGALFAPPKSSAKPVAVIWVHGWGTNFYSPTYTGIGRALAERGYTTVSGNTRMHDLGNVAGWKNGKRIRGGGYWGIAADEVIDLAAWVDLAERQGFRRAVLVGHSAGWAAVRSYLATRQDARIVGAVLASGQVRPNTQPPDPDQLAQANRMIAAGQPEDLVRDPKRSFPSFISAATFLDMANAPAESKDFFGIQYERPAVTRVHCPLLAFFGDHGDVGGQADLDLLTSALRRHKSGPSRVDTAIIRSADHMYTGQEQQVADVIARWADRLTAQ